MMMMTPSNAYFEKKEATPKMDSTQSHSSVFPLIISLNYTLYLFQFPNERQQNTLTHLHIPPTKVIPLNQPNLH